MTMQMSKIFADKRMDRQAKTTGPSSFNTGHKNISVKNFTPF
jgi:hypothetical protein